ncbi:MAG: hypothetical protein ACRDFB_10010, partial [Rhabdochlamydiaceae bacterium]
KLKYIRKIRKTMKSQFRKASYQVFKGRNEQQKQKEVQEYLRQATGCHTRCTLVWFTVQRRIDRMYEFDL